MGILNSLFQSKCTLNWIACLWREDVHMMDIALGEPANAGYLGSNWNNQGPAIVQVLENGR